MKADNNSLTEADREKLKSAVYNLITLPSHEEYILSMLASANPDNLDQIYKGFISVPTPYRDAGFEVVMWNSQGSLETPWYGGNFRGDY